MTEAIIRDRGGAFFKTVVVGNGRFLPFFHRTDAAEIIEINDQLPDLPLLEDDVLLCSFPKTGTHWLHEVITMILNQSAERVPSSKMTLMFEACTQSEMENCASPRVMNTHLQQRYWPRDVKNKQMKTVLVLRNPKDTAVSFYNHCIGYKRRDYDGKWEDWLPAYMEGEMEYGLYEEYLQGWEKAIHSGLGFPLHIVYYEDMHKNGMSEIQRLSDFLGVKLDTNLQADILDNCSFKIMSKEKLTDGMEKKMFKEHFNIYRKGEVGDWKNWFTVAQNETFDKMWNSRMAGYTVFKFRYQLK